MKKRGRLKIDDEWYDWFVVDNLDDIPAMSFRDIAVIVPNTGSDATNLQVARAAALSLHLYRFGKPHDFSLD